MRDYEFTIQANAQDSKTVGGNFIKVKSSTVELRVLAETNEGRTIADLRMTSGTSVALPERFEKVRVENSTGSTVKAVLIVGLGNFVDNELTGTITASRGATLKNSAATVGTTAAQLLAADAARRSVIIANEDPTNDIYIGSDNTVTAGTGLKVTAGQTLVLDHAAGAAVWAIGSATGITVKTLEELD